jgi:thiamine-phosphate pyrophosphorylase
VVTAAHERRARLHDARLYLVGGIDALGALGPALAGGVDAFQLREKHAGDDAILAAAASARALCDAAGALFFVNDRPDLAAAAGADGVHVGQDDVPVARARALAGEGLLVGLSTHTPEQVDAAGDAGADYIGVGPVHATPTKAGRPAVGTALVAHAAAHASMPFFAIGGIDAATAPAVVAAGALRLAVVRAITGAADPESAARALRAAAAEESAHGLA